VRRTPLGLDYEHALFEKFKDHTTRDAYATPFSCGFHDYVEGEPKDFFAYIRPNCAEWTDLIVNVHKRLVESFPIDMILLDQHYYHFNDPGCDFDQAIPPYYARIAEATRPALLAGECCHERSIITDVPLSVISWGMYASAVRPAWMKIHPLVVELFRDFVVFCGYEGILPAPGHRHSTGWPSDAQVAEMGWTFEDQQERAKRLHLVPTLRITPRYGGLDDQTAAIIKQAADFSY